jgi:hypothetical protein
MENDIRAFMAVVLLLLTMLLLLMSTSLLADSKPPCSMIATELQVSEQALSGDGPAIVAGFTCAART